MKRRLFLIGVILATLFIFYNSFQPAKSSDATSNIIIDAVMESAKNSGHTWRRLYVGKTIRKIAHILEFALQGFFITGCFSGVFKKRIIYVLFFGLLTGCIDEFIQVFSEGRTALVPDIFFDFSGTILGLSIFALMLKLKNKYKKGYN